MLFMLHTIHILLYSTYICNQIQFPQRQKCGKCTSAKREHTCERQRYHYMFFFHNLSFNTVTYCLTVSNILLPLQRTRRLKKSIVLEMSSFYPSLSLPLSHTHTHIHSLACWYMYSLLLQSVSCLKLWILCKPEVKVIKPNLEFEVKGWPYYKLAI